MKFLKNHWLLFLIIIFGLVVRLVALGEVPAGLNRDEAALAYNALLLKETGQDEWGRTWPVGLESFGDYKLIGYPAILTGFFSVFGISDWTVRLPSVLAGTVLIYLSYYWAKKLKLSNQVALLTALVMALTPVFFFYSRIAFEANVGLVLLVGALSLVLFNDKQSWWRDLASVMLMVAAVFTYNTPLLLLPFLLLAIPAFRGIKHWQKWGPVALSWLIVGALALTLLLPLTSQKKGITIFSDETIRDAYQEYRDQFYGPAQTLFGNQYVYFGREIINNTIETFSPKFLVLRGGQHPWHQVPNTGHVLGTIYVLAALGTLMLLLELIGHLVKKRSLDVPQPVYLLYLLIIAVAPAVVTVDAPHATRSLFFFFILTIISMYCFQRILSLVKGKDITQALMGLLVLLLVAETVNYANHYFYLYPRENVFQTGYETVVREVEKTYPTVPVAVIDPDGYQYISTAWYLKLSPQEYFETVSRQLPNQIGFRYGEQVSRYHFIANEADRDDTEKVLIFWDKADKIWRVSVF